ncbi:MAG: ABC transporter ATP-binding protein [Chloroflexi bacterium]|nr:ABC transporter ATP-binding protein [Chloroflexota bacterium]
MSNAAVVTNAGAAVLEDVVKHFKSGPDIVRAVDGVSVAIPRGKLVALKGPSGCGKSTLLNLMGALDRLDSGRITVDGTDVSGLSGAAEVAYRRDKVGFVFQMFNLMPYLSAIENVMLPMELRGKPNAQGRRTLAESLLARVKLGPDRHRRRPTRLSGGEQQRVAIARALANDPPLILADEPTANLDSTTGEQIVQLLRSLASGDRTVLIATHDTSIARQADLVITMRDGKFVRPDSAPPGD